MPTIFAFAWLLLFGLAALGCGSLVRRVAGQVGGSTSTTLGVGFAVLVAIGGVLNLGRVAYAPALVAVLVASASYAVLVLVRSRPALPADAAARLELAITAAAVLGVLGVAAFAFAPPRVFNFHDDLQKYLLHPVRMLATGTLAATPLSALGFETLGGQAFLQGLLICVLPLPFAGALELVGLGLLLFLCAAAGWRRGSWFPAALVGPILVASVNAQVVNVSALYSAAALIATAVLLVADDEAPPSPLALGLVYAAMVALKPTFALFAAAHLPLAAVAVHRAAGARRAATWAARVILAAAACIAPWILLHLPTYLGPRSALAPAPPGWNDPFDLLSPAPLFYGTSALHYTALGAASLLAALLGGLAALGDRSGPEGRRGIGIVAAAIAGVVPALLLVFVTGPLHTGHEVGLRYAVPFLLGASVPAIALALGQRPRWSRAASVVLVATALSVAASFVPVALARVRRAIAYGTLLAFPSAPAYQPYTAYALSGQARSRVRGLQEKVPPGQRVFAWINFPYHLDLRRNAIEVVEPTAFGTPWARLPDDVSWVLWQYRGFATRTPEYLASVARGPGGQERRTALGIARFTHELEELVEGGKIVADDGEFRLIRLARP